MNSIHILYFILLALIGSETFAFEKGKVEVSLKHGLEEYLETGHKSEELNQALEQVQLPHLFRRGDEKGIVEQAACTACDVGLGVLLHARRRGASDSIITRFVENLCVWFDIESEAVCKGTVQANIGTILYIVDNKPELTAKRICSILLQEMNCNDPTRQDWNIKIPPPQPIRNTEITAKETKPYKILQLTDFHYDPGYSPGSNGACDEPLCCQPGSKPANPEDAAGYWGDYRSCDTPWHALIDTLDHIVSQHRNLDYVYFTGDIINHKVWDTDVERNSKAISDTLSKLQDFFGNLPIFPILGNHEPHPVNIFSAEGITDPDLSTSWVFDLSAKEWQRWLPKETLKTILRGGYYTVLVKPGFRIIALNSNVCYTFNWWLLYDDFDQYGQLQWLADTLFQAEKDDEKVHILSHVPTGDSTCLHNWSKEYVRIINRFSHIITAQFTGHTHHDETVIFFDTENPSEAINVAFNGGSITTFSHLNPNYKIYDIDSNNLEVINFESWSYSVSEANKNPELNPNWFKLYSFKEDYNVTSLAPGMMAQLAEEMAKKPKLTEQYFRYKHRESDTSIAKGCDRNCELKNLCYMVTAVHGEDFHCQLLTEMYNNHRPVEEKMS